MISVTRIDDTTFEVTVDAGSVSKHTVSVSAEYHRRLTDGNVSAEELVKKSFEFLLEREPNTNILRSFNLTLIGKYFSEYEAVIKKVLCR